MLYDVTHLRYVVKVFAAWKNQSLTVCAVKWILILIYDSILAIGNQSFSSHLTISDVHFWETYVLHELY